MQTLYLKINPPRIDLAQLKKAAAIIKNGGLVAFPTDTVYGLGASALSKSAVQGIFRIKKRSPKKQLPIFLPSKKEVSKFVQKISPCAQKLIKKHWPGPLTLVFSANNLGSMITGGSPTIALRIPDQPVVLKMLKITGVPWAVTSVNLSGEKSAVSFKEVKKLLDGKIDLIIDSGRCPLGKESTVVDVSVFPPHVLREGYIKKHELIKLSSGRIPFN